MQDLPSRLPKIVGDDEKLARFLASDRLFNKSGLIRPAAYMPNPAHRNSSVFREEGGRVETLKKIWAENQTGDRSLHAIAICKARDVRAAALDVASEEPPPKHANIVGWPWNDAYPEIAKAEQKERAAVIAQSAELIRL